MEHEPNQTSRSNFQLRGSTQNRTMLKDAVGVQLAKSRSWKTQRDKHFLPKINYKGKKKMVG